jgi:hypothetical protein
VPVNLKHQKIASATDARGGGDHQSGESASMACPSPAKDGVRAEEALLDAAVRGRRRALAEHLMLRLLLLVLWQVRLSVLPHVA